MATHSSVLAWRIPGMGEPGGLPSMGLHRVRHDWSDLAAAAGLQKIEKKIESSYLRLFLSHSFDILNWCDAVLTNDKLILTDFID